MLIEAPYKVGDTVTFKLNSGEEIVGKLTEENEKGFKILNYMNRRKPGNQRGDARRRSVWQASWRGCQSNILPGFRMWLGSSAFRSSRRTFICESPANFGRKSFFARPMPCSPVMVPPISMAFSKIS